MCRGLLKEPPVLVGKIPTANDPNALDRHKHGKLGLQHVNGDRTRYFKLKLSLYMKKL